MAVDAVFFTVPNVNSALLGNAETNLQVPTTTSTIITAGANGTKVEQIDIVGTTTSLAATTVAGLVYVFLFDGSTYHLYDTVAVSAVTGSSTAAPYRSVASNFASGTNRPPNLILKSGWSLRASQSVAGNASILKITVVAADA